MYKYLIFLIIQEKKVHKNISNIQPVAFVYLFLRVVLWFQIESLSVFMALVEKKKSENVHKVKKCSQGQKMFKYH